MCGINGCTYRDRALVERMNTRTRHRGPDGTGIFEDGAVTLGHNRLAIIDLSPKGAQPMKSSDGRFVITFNGEIYNYKELREELKGYKFASQSDTEVILAGFARWGTGVFERLNGIFAFALWDSREKELYLVRDRIGIKPLYVFRDGSQVLFSSEIKAILESPHVKRELNRDALPMYLRLGYVPGEDTLFKGIKRLPAGHFARMRGISYDAQCYWAAPVPKEELRGEEAGAAIRATVERVVSRQLVSDRPLGVFLSGGIDSSTVVDAMSRVRDSIDTYSIGFDLQGHEQTDKFNADFMLARRTAAHYGTRHHEFMLDAQKLPELLEDVVYHLDEPVGNATGLAQFVLARLAKETVTVVLSGDGGDELFGGYPRYLLSRRMDAYQRLVPGALRATLARWGKFSQLNTPAGAERYDLFHFIKTRSLKDVAPAYAGLEARESVERVLRDRYQEMSFCDAFMRLDTQWWLADESLIRTDKLCMASAVEARVPLLDNEVIDLAARIPIDEKVTLTQTKRVFKNAFRGRLPEYLYKEPKRGWFSPGAKWLRLPEFREYAAHVLSPGYTEATRELFDWNGVEKVFLDHVEGRRYNLPLLWALLSLQVWAKTFKVTL